MNAHYLENNTNDKGYTPYSPAPEVALYNRVATISLDNLFHNKNTAMLVEISSLMEQTSPEFVAKLAVYCRNNLRLRRMAMVLAVALDRIHRGDGLVSKIISRVIQGPDEMMEFLACYRILNDKKGLSKQVQKGLAIAFNNISECECTQLSRSVTKSLRDALLLVHPKPKNAEQQALFNKIARQELPRTGNRKEKLSAAKKIWQEAPKGRNTSTSVVYAYDIRPLHKLPITTYHSIWNYQLRPLLYKLLQYKYEEVQCGILGRTLEIADLYRNDITPDLIPVITAYNRAGYNANGHLVLEELVKRKYKADKIMLFTYTQLWNTEQHPGSMAFRQAWTAYKQLFPTAKLYLFNYSLKGESRFEVIEEDVYALAGKNEKIVEMMEILDNRLSAFTDISAILL
ncbi:hypothetical protein CLV59_103596 [Chitinophaga dinghuensis]|uniref:TROVE domain-containing protein n=1 Tax=Chitinophaga dinghuensis TaxID=1539050 RepID=A0A327W632_9BACT|nr:TROVE domain-containing protein [Chitinophaga dinghuensis]RAJ83625.1 hypothetical protein CLV59_103596 [Chitinophaga dinghuensis]